MPIGPRRHSLRKNVRTKTRHSQRFTELTKGLDKEQLHDVTEAIAAAKKTASAKFPETIDIALRLGIDPKKSDQNVRGITILPHGTGKTKKVAVLAKGELAAAAEKAGADIVGEEDLIAKIQNGFKDFDTILAAEDMAPQIGKIGRMLGPKTPNKRNGTVTNNIEQAVREIKMATRVEYRADKGGVVHMPIGKVNFDDEKLLENFNTALDAVIKAKPASTKGRYLVGVTVSSTMGPGYKIDPLLAAKSSGH